MSANSSEQNHQLSCIRTHRPRRSLSGLATGGHQGHRQSNSETRGPSSTRARASACRSAAQRKGGTGWTADPDMPYLPWVTPFNVLALVHTTLLHQRTSIKAPTHSFQKLSKNIDQWMKDSRVPLPKKHPLPIPSYPRSKSLIYGSNLFGIKK